MIAPHDRLFRYLFAPPARAEALLRHNLPAPLITEHQSTVDRWMALRMLDYCWRLIQHWRELNPHSLWIPEVTALVVYPRRGRCWSAPLRLEEHYRREGAGRESYPWSLRSLYRIDDLSLLTEREVRARMGPPLVPLGLLVLSYAGTEQLALRLPYWSDLFAQVQASAHGPQALYRIVRYVHHLGDEAAVAKMDDVLHSIMESGRAEALMRTMADVLRERGREEGLAKGEAQGLAKGVLRLLATRGVQVDEVSRQRIQSCLDVALLESWLERAMVATRISEVLEGPAQ